MKSETTKTEQLRAAVFAQILRGEYQPGARLPTERDMAQLTKMSRVTVRRAYAELEQAGILKRTQGSGTEISTALRGNSAAPREVALVSARLDRFSVEFVAAMEAALRARDVLLVLKITDSPQAEEEAVLDLMACGVRNLVIWPQGGGRLPELARRLRVLGANLVFFDRMLPGESADFVGLDNAAAMRLLLDHAQSAGCRRMVFVGHAGLNVDSDRLRRESFERLCKERGLAYELCALPWEGERQAAARDLLHAQRAVNKSCVPAAYLCVNDSLALELRAADAAVPHLYGIDGFVNPARDRIVTVQQPLDTLAQETVALLFRQQKLGDKWKSKEVLLKGRLLE